MQITLEQLFFPVQTSPKNHSIPEKDKNKNSSEGTFLVFISTGFAYLIISKIRYLHI